MNTKKLESHFKTKVVPKKIFWSISKSRKGFLVSLIVKYKDRYLPNDIIEVDDLNTAINFTNHFKEAEIFTENFNTNADKDNTQIN